AVRRCRERASATAQPIEPDCSSELEVRSAMPLPPALTPEQRQAALEKAAVARRQRAEVQEKLKANSLSLAELFEQGDRDETLAKLKVVSVLESLPGVGKVRARRLMQELDISESRRLRGLGRNQREALLKRLGCSAARPGAPSAASGVVLGRR